jgi:hypothetical protein
MHFIKRELQLRQGLIWMRAEVGSRHATRYI